MKKATFMSALLFALLCLPTSILAVKSDKFDTAIGNPEQIPKTPPQQSINITDSKFKIIDSGKIKATTTGNAIVANGLKYKAKDNSVTDITGEYVLTYKALNSTSSDSGIGVTIEADADNPNGVKFVNFFDVGIIVKGTVDIASQTVTIPNQVVYEHPTEGTFDICAVGVDSKGNPIAERDKPIEGTINADGSISISTWWGMFVKEGTSAGNNAGLFQNTTLERANATMSQTAMITDQQPFTYQTTEYNVLATQSAPNVLTIKNFGNYGQTVEFLLNSDNTATIYSQAAMKDSNIGTLMTNSIIYDESTGELKSLTGDIRTETAADKKIINWKDWTLANQSSYTYIFTKGSISLTFDVSYPQQTASDFKGEGTADSPYLIESPEHLILLSQKVNSIKESDYNATASNGSRYARVFLGKYFRITSDIDMQNYRFTPIGNDWYHHFAGTFDGNGHKIKGLSISTRDEGYAALFGRCDTLSVISNLTIESPVIRTQGYYAASVAGWTLGTLENCHVVNADIISEGRVAGSLAATARIVKNCTASNGKATCFGGHLGGLIGQVTELITNSNATDMTVIGYSPEELFPVGGLTGSLYKAKAEKCYFSGTVDTRTYQAENLQVGGIAGFCQGEITQCFSVGTVNGYKSEARTGGIVGALFGKITDSYSAGAIYNPESEYTGGLIGYATAYSDDKGNTAQPEVRNCYTTASVSAAVYLYNSQTEIRETIGIIEKNTTPVIENILFDRKITNFNSKQFGTSTEQLTKSSGIVGFDSSIWTFSEGQYPRLTGIDENEAAYMSASVIDMGKNSNLKKLSNNAILKPLGNTEYLVYKDGTLGKVGNFCSIEGNTLTVSEKFGTDIIAVRNGSVQYLLNANITPIKFEGEGSEENPLLLKTKDDLKILADITTNLGQTFADTFFKLANDIDMQYDKEFIGICTNESSSDNMFAGTLDGGGFAIHNLYINGVVWKTEPTEGLTQGGNPDRYESVSYKGLIGRLAPLGTVKNLSIAADAQLLFFGTSAPIVAYNYGTIENCRNYAEVVGLNSYIGGIVGRNLKGGKITSCYNAGNVTVGNGNAGGITGSAEGIIEKCVNVGDVAAKSISLYIKPGDRGLKFAGGIVGMGGALSGSVIRNCVNAGAIFAEYSNAGGIAGAYKKITTNGDGRNDMENSINFGTVTSGNPELTGSLGGEAGTDGTIANNFWDNQITPLKAIGNSDLEGMTGVETSALISGTPLSGFDAELWNFTAGQYPVLKLFANEEKLTKARKVIVTMKPGVTAKDMSQNAKLAVEDGLKWSMEKGDAFAVAGNNLYSPEEVDDLVIDNLIADFGDYVKKIELRRIPAVPLSGLGTSEDPYLISTSDDWNNLSDYMSTISESFKDKYVTVSADIDFTDKEFKMLASDNVTLWQGNLNGNGKTISGIKLEAADEGYGAIRSIGEFGAVSNLTIAGDITSSYAETGGFSSYVYGNISNCVNKVNVTSTKGNNTSGFGILYSTANLTDCVNKASISGKGRYIAGLASEVSTGAELVRCGNEGKISNAGRQDYTAGLIGTAKPILMEECYNSGEVEISDLTYTVNVAGLIAYANSDKDATTPMTLIGCYNTADITTYSVAAGLIAATNATSSITNPIVMISCYNTGNISTVSKRRLKTPTAGLIAYYTPGSQLTDCWNSGNITTPNVYTGGIAGYYKQRPNETNPIKLSGCHNTGLITANGGTAAGIIAYTYDYTTIENCHNSGNIEGGNTLGGIAGSFNGENSEILNCYNTGNLTTFEYNAGGLIGGGEYGKVNNCLNIGDIKTAKPEDPSESENGYAIGGLAGQGAAIFTNSYNLGTVAGENQAGGLIGVPVSEQTQVIRCYNMGAVSATEDSGALIGADLKDADLWSETNKVEGSYFTTALNANDNNTVGTATTVAALAKADMGEGWTSGDDYTLPIPTPFVANPYALINAVTVAFAEGDNANSVTKDFFVGAPEGIAWTASVDNISFSGTNAVFANKDFAGKATLTATAGELTRTFEITCDKKAGVGYIVGGKVIVKEVFYNTYGVEVPEPEGKDGNVYIVVRTYDDGTSETLKFFNVK